MNGNPQITESEGFQQRMQEYYGRINQQSLAPLWEILKNLVAVQPRSTTQPFLWRYDDVLPYLLEAGGLLTAEEAERRVLVLENPTFRGQGKTTQTLYGGIQLVLPGEIAPAHRHVASALRFVLQSEGGYTVVGGEKTYMEPGDFVVTPSWAWHDHGSDSQAPVTWLDILDVPMINFFDVSFAEHYNGKTQSILRGEGDALARFGNGMVPMMPVSPFGLTSPIFNYPFARTRASLAAIASAELDPHWGATLRYAHPIDGGWPMPTIATWMSHFPADTATQRLRSTDGMIVAVAEGRGVIKINDQRFAFGPRDVFAIPNWAWRSFEASEDCYLFFSSDRAAQEKLGFWREEKAET